MRATLIALLVAALAAAGGPSGALGQQQGDDAFEGLPAGPGQEEVYYACAACHSIRLVQQQGLSRERWDKLLVWMVEQQGMPEPPEEERALMLDYLAEHYGPDARRPPAVSAPGSGFGPAPLTPPPRAGGM